MDDYTAKSKVMVKVLDFVMRLTKVCYYTTMTGWHGRRQMSPVPMPLQPA